MSIGRYGSSISENPENRKMSLFFLVSFHFAKEIAFAFVLPSVVLIAVLFFLKCFLEFISEVKGRSN